MLAIEIWYLWSSFNDFAIKNFTSFIAMTLIIATKTITAVFGTMALQLIKEFQCSVTYSMKQTMTVTMLSLISLCVIAGCRYNIIFGLQHCDSQRGNETTFNQITHVRVVYLSRKLSTTNGICIWKLHKMQHLKTYTKEIANNNS